MKLLAFLLGVWSLYVLNDTKPRSQTYDELCQLLERLTSGRSRGTKAARHILGDYMQAFKANPELFSFSEPYPLDILETGERVWAVDLKVWRRGRDKFRRDAQPDYTEPALFRDTNSKTLQTYIH